MSTSKRFINVSGSIRRIIKVVKNEITLAPYKEEKARGVEKFKITITDQDSFDEAVKENKPVDDAIGDYSTVLRSNK